MPIKGRIAIVVPCYNEEAGIDHLIEALCVTKNQVKNYALDVVLINDGSSDATQQHIELSAKKYSFIYYRSFARNVGHQAALRAGIDACGGYDAVVMMDGDMQHPPELIPDMIKAWEDGANIVQMVRRDSAKETGMFKYLTSKLYYKVINAISSLNMQYGASDFRLIDKSVVAAVIESRERDLFLRGYFAWLPASRVAIPYKPAERFAGSSKYTFKKMFELAAKGILQFSEKPLYIATNIGLLTALASILYGAMLIIRYFSGGHVVSGWTSLMVVMLFCFGINFTLLGIIGQYLAHALRLQKNRPEYVIQNQKLRKME